MSTARASKPYSVPLATPLLQAQPVCVLFAGEEACCHCCFTTSRAAIDRENLTSGQGGKKFIYNWASQVPFSVSRPLLDLKYVDFGGGSDCFTLF